MLIGVLASTAFSFKTKQDLGNALDDLQESVVDKRHQSLEVIDTVASLIATPLTLAVGNRSVFRGGVVDIPIYFRADPENDIASLQFDLLFSTPILVNQLIAGPAALFSGKSLQGVATDNGYRGIIFGLNQSAIPSGTVANIRLEMPSDLAVGIQPITIDRITGSSPVGDSIPLNGVDGSVMVE